jgi:hypothetical protein
MSKQSVAKAMQGWRKASAICDNCKWFTFDPQTSIYGHSSRKNFRCGIGNFATTTTATCDKHEPQTL